MHRQVHLAEIDGLQGFLLSINGDSGAGTGLVRIILCHDIPHCPGTSSMSAVTGTSSALASRANT